MQNKITFIITCLITIFFSQQALAQSNVLKAKEINTLVLNTTMTITEARPDKKTNKKVKHLAFFSDTGSIRSMTDDGLSEFYSWSVQPDDTLCVRNISKLYGRSVFCGFIVRENENSYKLYKVESGTSKKNKQYVSIKKQKYILTLSDFKKGDHLPE